VLAEADLGLLDRGDLRVFRLAEVSLGELLIHEFETAFPKLDRTGLALRKSIAVSVLRFLGRESIVTKRVALGEGTGDVRQGCSLTNPASIEQHLSYLPPERQHTLEKAFENSAMAVQRSKRLFSRLARCLPACRKGMRSENPRASYQPRDSKWTLTVEVTLKIFTVTNSKTSFSLRF